MFYDISMKVVGEHRWRNWIDGDINWDGENPGGTAM